MEQINPLNSDLRKTNPADRKENKLISMFEKWAGEKAIKYIPLPASGSYREYYRIVGDSKSAIGVFNEDVKENTAFLSFTESFKNVGIPVPEIYVVDSETVFYLIEDLGDETLFSFLTKRRDEIKQKPHPDFGIGFDDELIDIYKKILE